MTPPTVFQRRDVRPALPGGKGLSEEGGDPEHMMLYNALISLFHRDEEGQGLAEYALILALIAIVAIIALIFLGGQVKTILSNVGTSI